MKKYIYIDLFHLSLVLSLLRLYPNLYRGQTWDAEPYGHEVYLGDSTAYTQARFHNLNNNRLNGFIHPKNVDDAYERSLFIHDVNSLCRRPDRNSNTRNRGTNIFAYIVNELQPHSIASATEASDEPQASEPQREVVTAELTQADMDLIEILWKQDIDMGVSRDVFDGTWREKQDAAEKQTEKLNASVPSSSFSSPWQGLNYSIDSETGEHIVLPLNATSNNAVAQVPNGYVDITLEEALSLFETEQLDIDFKPDEVLPSEDFLLGPELPYSNQPIQDQSLLEQLQDLQEMVSEVQAEEFPEQYESLNNGLIDISQTYNETDNSTAILDALLQNTTLALPMNETLLTVPYHPGDQFGMDVDANINTLLSFLSNDSDPNPVGAVGGEDQLDLSPNLPIANLTVDTNFLTQLLNEENIDFSDLSVLPTNPPNEEWRTSTSSDSAVSSMGSDWSNVSSSESTNGDSVMKDSTGSSFSFHSNMFSPENSRDWGLPKPALAAPKKYHLFGKQQPQGSKDEDSVPEQQELKFVTPGSPEETYSNTSSVDYSNPMPRLPFMHNHTYHFAGDAVPDEGASQKPLERDKSQSTYEGSVRGTRDEKRLRNANLPLSLKEIVELPIERFNERMSQLNLTEEHMNLLRDIRRRGKNKLAARTCRKRKIDQISELQVSLDDLYEKRNLMRSEMEKAIVRRDMLKQKYQKLYSFIFPDRDPPEPIPSSSLYLQEDSVVPASHFPLSSNGTTSVNDTEHNKRGKHKGAENK